MMPSIILKNLRIRRGRQVVIDQLTLEYHGPGWLGIIGANGSGKTSLLRGISGRIPVESGQILIDQCDQSANRESRAQIIGFAIDPASLPGELTPREVFAITADAQQADQAPELAGLRKALQLDGLMDRRCNTLSSGNAQRIAIFAAFLNQPDIVILDEPFNWLDPLTAYDLKNALQQFVKDRGVLLITAIHDFSTLARYCDHGILLNLGRISMHITKPDLAAGLADFAKFEHDMAQHLREDSA